MLLFTKCVLACVKLARKKERKEKKKWKEKRTHTYLSREMNFQVGSIMIKRLQESVAQLERADVATMWLQVRAISPKKAAHKKEIIYSHR